MNKEQKPKWVYDENLANLVNLLLSVNNHIPNLPNLTNELNLTLIPKILEDRLNNINERYINVFAKAGYLMMQQGVFSYITKKAMTFIYIPSWNFFIITLYLYDTLLGNNIYLLSNESVQTLIELQKKVLEKQNNIQELKANLYYFDDNRDDYYVKEGDIVYAFDDEFDLIKGKEYKILEVNNPTTITVKNDKGIEDRYTVECFREYKPF